MYADRDYVDVTVNIIWNDPGCGLKLELPVAAADRFIGQTSFGIQEYESELEQCSHRFCGVEQDGKMLAVFKRESYGCSMESGKLYLNLINGSIYCAHPVGELPIVDHERHNPYLEVGRHTFHFRLSVCDEGELERLATEFVQKPYALNFYPHGEGKKEAECPLEISDKDIVLSCFRQLSDGSYMVRLMNNLKSERGCICRVLDRTLSLTFGKYEAKTLLYKHGELKELDSLLAL
jgi:alpha-mannosidase